MTLKIKSIKLVSFKGVKEAEYVLGGGNKILGENGSGKTTIASAHYWLWADKDYELHSNPNIRPDDMEECLPRVEEVLDIDGKEVIIAKQQKKSVSKPNDKGVSKITLTNSYEVNSVPKTERDFKDYLEVLGVDFDKMLALSHPDVFTGKKASEMRSVLFEMAESKTDLAVANMTEGCSDVAALLEDYKLEEIEAMNKASKKKAEEQVKAIPNQIIGMEKAKVDIDVAELELQRNGLKEQISDYENKISDGSVELDKMQNGIMELQLEVNGIYQKANDALIVARRAVQRRIDEATDNFNVAESQHKLSLKDIERGNAAVERNEQEKVRLQNLWKEEKRKEFPDFEELPALDENSLICPTCGQALPEELRKEKIATYEERKEIHRKTYENSLEKFESDKEKRLAEITEQGNAVVAVIKTDKENIAQLEKQVEQYKADKIRFNADKNKAMEELTKLPKEPNMLENQEYERLSLELAARQKAIEELRNGADYTVQYKTKLAELREELSNVEAEIAKSQNNVRIDEQIAELQQKQREYEQAKANAEKILYQLSLVSKAKNELLVNDINSHFEIVRWKMFEYQKNSEYKECCIPLVPDERTGIYKEFGTSTNTGKEVLAKLDIIKGLQKFYGQSYPVFLDGAECLSDNTADRVDMDCQMISLCVSEDKELRVEVVA